MRDKNSLKHWAWCPICNRGFISQRAVDAHQRIHKKEKDMAKKEQKEFPQEVFLKLETETNDDPYFVHYESAEEVAEAGKEINVGVYRLAGTAKVKAPVTVEGENTNQ